MEPRPRDIPSAQHLVVFAVCIAVAAVILLRPLFHPRGLVGTDDLYYLRQAAFFLESRGVHSFHYGYAVVQRAFVTWPLGYPLAIALVAKLTGLGVFWASKLANLLAMLASIFLLTRGLPRTGWFASLAFLTGGALAIYPLSASEGLFTFTLLLAAVALARYLEWEKPRDAVLLAIAAVAAYSLRYAGVALHAGILLACGWTYLDGQRRKARWLAAVLAVSGAFAWGYSQMNRSLTGEFFSGRGPAGETLGEFFYFTGRALAAEANPVFVQVPNISRTALVTAFFVTLSVSAFVVLRVLWVGRSRSRWDSSVPLSSLERRTLFILATAGAGFLLFMISMRFFVYFNQLDFRLMGPGTLLIMSSGLGFLWAHGLRELRVLQVLVAALLLISLAYHGVWASIENYAADPVLFGERLTSVSSHYAEVPPETVVLCGDRNLLYLRPDVLVVLTRWCVSKPRVDELIESAVATERPVWLDGEDGLVPIR